ncbi:hypothetical protein K7X08_025037 [Anisodus acutangulus]|uniref:Uncharacterized protein n=1 Tax=Anisodus acutangulus TaxID=402998 RepID=A0A9Q1M924_9SOLA|nr:hypothetical protein K7X08_025037 [Anisodus acutangulus]
MESHTILGFVVRRPKEVGPSTATPTTSTVVGPSARPRRRPRKETVAAEAPPKLRGTPKKESSALEGPPKPKGRPRRRENSHAPAVVPRRKTENPSTYPYKRAKTVDMRVFVAENGYTSLNHGMPSSRVLNLGDKQPIRQHIRFVDVTWDLGHQTRTEMRFKDKQCYIRSMFEEITREKMNKTTTRKGKEP